MGKGDYFYASIKLYNIEMNQLEEETEIAFCVCNLQVMSKPENLIST